MSEGVAAGALIKAAEIGIGKVWKQEFNPRSCDAKPSV